MTEKYRLKAEREGQSSHFEMWTLRNRTVPFLQKLGTNELRFAIKVYCSIEHNVNWLFNNGPGPVITMLGMSTMTRCKSRMHFVMNLLGLIPLYKSMDRIRKKLITKNMDGGRNLFENFTENSLAILSVDNLDTTDQHGLIISVSQSYGLHLTAIQAAISPRVFDGQ